MSTILRTLRNLRRIGLRDAGHQLQYQGTSHSAIHSTVPLPSIYFSLHDDTITNKLMLSNIGDTKAGTLIGTDRYGNKFFENLEEELPLRTRWVDYKDKELDASHIDPGWHAWISYMVDKAPTEDKLMQMGLRPWESPTPRTNYTQSRGAYRPYNT